MDIQDIRNLKPNSYKYKAEQKEAEERKKIDKVVQGTVKTKKRNEFSKIVGAFISEEAKNVKDYALYDILIPAAKDCIMDIVNKGLRLILRGSPDAGSKRSLADKVSYRNFYDRRDEDRRPVAKPATRYSHSYDDILLETKGEAEHVLDRMSEIIQTYDVVSVADLYELVGLQSTYTDQNYGWDDLSSATSVYTRDGYLLRLPRIKPIR